MLKLLLVFVPKAFPIFAAVVVIYGGACLFLFKQQTRMIFFPEPVLEVTPADFGLDYEDLWIPVETGQRPSKLHGWWIPSNIPDAKILLYLHGNGENVGGNASKAAWFHSLGLSVLLIDYRGYGLSDGPFPNEKRVYEDAEAAWQYLIQDKEARPDDVVLFGHSLGGAIAIELATHRSTVAGLIVEGSFTSLLDMSDRTKNFGIFPIQWLLTERFDSIGKVRSLKMPILFVHGTADDVVPCDMSETLYRASTSTSKELLLIEGAGHEDVAEVGGDTYGHAVQRFIQGRAVAP